MARIAFARGRYMLSGTLELTKMVSVRKKRRIKTKSARSPSPRGYNQPVLDSIIAATALHHELVLVTRDAEDFRRVAGLKLENPFVCRPPSGSTALLLGAPSLK